MNHCYYCSKLVDRGPYNPNLAQVCDGCKQRAQERKARGQHALTGAYEQPPLSTQLARYWTAMETSDRNTLLLLYGDVPLTDEELVTMEGQAQ